MQELDYLMQKKRWREANEKNWRFILYSAGREKQGHLELDNIKNFKCEDLKQLDSLWIEHSQGHFGYSVQKKIYLASGNSLDFDWEKEEWKKWNEKGYIKFVESVRWKVVEGDWIRHEELPMNLENPREGAPEGMLPNLYGWGKLRLPGWEAKRGEEEGGRGSVGGGGIRLLQEEIERLREKYRLQQAEQGMYYFLFLQRLVDCSR